jgi:hypothetical protein
MDNTYLDVADFLIKNSHLLNVSFNSIPIIIICFVISLVFTITRPSNQNNNFTSYYVIIILMTLAAIFTINEVSNQKNKMEKLKDELHILATKHNVDDTVVFEIANDIIFCEPNFLKYTTTPSKTIKCENEKYYGKYIDNEKVKENLNYISTIQDR